MNIAAAKFKATCLQLMTLVDKTGQEITITKRGRPFAKLSAARVHQPAELFGKLARQTRIRGDLIAPLGEHWDADAR